MEPERTSYKLNIPSPCYEKWDEMETKDNNKFCSSCHKTIIDFTTYSNSELIKYIEKSQGEICGRLRNDQIDVDIFKNNTGKSNLFKWIASIALLFLSKISYSSSNIKINESTIQTDSTSQKIDTTKVEKTKIVGFVYDSITKEPLSYGWALIKDTKIATRLDTVGRFELEIPKNIFQKEIIVEIRQLGFKKTYVKWYAEELTFIKNIYMSNKKNSTKVGIIIPKKNIK